MRSMATVATRLAAIRLAMAVPARSIWDTSQPPKISPKPLVSRGSAVICRLISPCGTGSSFSDSCMSEKSLPCYCIYSRVEFAEMVFLPATTQYIQRLRRSRARQFAMVPQCCQSAH